MDDRTEISRQAELESYITRFFTRAPEGRGSSGNEIMEHINDKAGCQVVHLKDLSSGALKRALLACGYSVKLKRISGRVGKFWDCVPASECTAQTSTDETMEIVRQVVKCAAANAVHADRVEAQGEAEFVRTARELIRDIEKAEGVVTLHQEVARLNQSKANGMRWALSAICRNRGVSVGEAKGMASMMEKAERTARELIRDIAVARDAAASLRGRSDEREALLKEGKVLGLEWALEVVCHFHGLDVQAVKEGMEDDEQDDG